MACAGRQGAAARGSSKGGVLGRHSTLAGLSLWLPMRCSQADHRPDGGRPDGRPDDRPDGRPDGRLDGPPDRRPDCQALALAAAARWLSTWPRRWPICTSRTCCTAMFAPGENCYGIVQQEAGCGAQRQHQTHT